MYLPFSSSNESYDLFEEVLKKHTKFVNLSNLNMSFHINTNEASMDLKIGFLEAKNKNLHIFVNLSSSTTPSHFQTICATGTVLEKHTFQVYLHDKPNPVTSNQYV